jgi:hypothetical protein
MSPLGVKSKAGLILLKRSYTLSISANEDRVSLIGLGQGELLHGQNLANTGNGCDRIFPLKSKI